MLSIAAIARVARTVCLGVWLGGIVMAFVAAPIIFQKLAPDKKKAGEINGAILGAAEKLQCGLAVIALLAEAALFFGAGTEAAAGWRRCVPGAFLVAAIVCGL